MVVSVYSNSTVHKNSFPLKVLTELVVPTFPVFAILMSIRQSLILIMFSPAIFHELKHIFIYSSNIWTLVSVHYLVTLTFLFFSSFLLQPVSLELKYILEINPLISNILPTCHSLVNIIQGILPKYGSRNVCNHSTRWFVYYTLV